MARSKLLVPPRDLANGVRHRITPKSAGWTYDGFETRVIAKGASARMKTGVREICIVALTGKIAPAFAKAVRAYQANYGWQGILYPGNTTSADQTADGGSLAIFNIPISTLGTSMQYVQNMETGAWCRFLGLNAFCWEFANNCIYFGSTNGVYQWDVGSSDNGTTIVADVLTAFSNFGSSVSKDFTMVRPLLKTSGIVAPAIDINADFNEVMPTATPSVRTHAGRARFMAIILVESGGVVAPRRPAAGQLIIWPRAPLQSPG